MILRSLFRSPLVVPTVLSERLSKKAFPRSAIDTRDKAAEIDPEFSLFFCWRNDSALSYYHNLGINDISYVITAVKKKNKRI